MRGRRGGSRLTVFLNVLGIWATASSVAEIVSRWGDVQVYGLRRLVLDIYVYAREALFFPIEWPLLQFHVEVPLLLKDVLVVYGIPFAATMANARNLRISDLQAYKENPTAFEEMIRKSATSIGKNADDLWRRVSKGLGSPAYYYWRMVRSAAQWPLTYVKNFTQIFDRNQAVRANAAKNVLEISIFTILPIILTVLFFAPEAIKVLLG